MKHWNPEDLLPSIATDKVARPTRAAWPEGATAGLVMVAACCLALGAMLYQFAGPRDVIEEGAARR